MYSGMTAMTINKSNVNPNLQWKYRELLSRTPRISKIINSNIVMDSANVMEKINCTDMCRIS